MYPKKTIQLKKQQGLSLALLLFIIIIIALLSTALARLNSQSSISNSQQVIAARAFFAAESGAQRQAMAIFPVSGVGSNCINQTYNFTTNGLTGCDAITTCSAITIGTETFYQVISQGRCSSGSDLSANRSIEVRLKTVN
jgi:MSHA biogenesis protein MshP